MQLSALGDPLLSWQYAERYLGGGTRRYSTFSSHLEVSTAYHPQHGEPEFAVDTFVVPGTSGGFQTNAIASRLPKLYGGAESFLLPVHPDILTNPELIGRAELPCRDRGPQLRVVPTANVRTVFVTRIGDTEVEPHFVKLHYPRRLSRFTRRLRRPIIETQLWVAEQLDRARVPFLREVAGGYFGDHPTEAWGFVIRECPTDLLTDGAYVLPVFALYGTDLRHPDDPPLIEQLIRASGQDPTAYLCERVVDPLVRLWCRILRDTGCVAEPHGQNTLFVFDPHDGTTQVIYRDCGIYVDPARRPAGSTLPPINVISRDVEFPAADVCSLAYDSFLAHHSLEFLAEVGQRRLGVSIERLRGTARQAFAEETAGMVTLPSTVRYYDDQLHPDGGWSLIDTGRTPHWR